MSGEEVETGASDSAPAISNELKSIVQTDEVETGAPDAAPAISNELKSIVQAGDDDRPTSNSKSLGYGIQQIKLEYWDPENEKYWDVSQLIFLLT